MLDEDGAPMAATTVAVRVQGQASAALVKTGPDGKAEVPFTAPGTGAFAVAVAFPGSASQAATTVSEVLRVRSAAASTLSPAWSVGAAALAVAALGAVAYGVRAWRHGRGASAVLRRAVASLSADGPWSAGVLLAYQGLSEHLRSRGLGERPDQSVRDYVASVVSATGVPESTAVEFVRLVERARYSQEPTTPMDALHARRVLNALIAGVEAHA
jgi:hypothetical protein